MSWQQFPLWLFLSLPPCRLQFCPAMKIAPAQGSGQCLSECSLFSKIWFPTLLVALKPSSPASWDSIKPLHWMLPPSCFLQNVNLNISTVTSLLGLCDIHHTVFKSRHSQHQTFTTPDFYYIIHRRACLKVKQEITLFFSSHIWILADLHIVHAIFVASSVAISKSALNQSFDTLKVGFLTPIAFWPP